MNALKYIGVISFLILLLASCNWKSKKQSPDEQLQNAPVPEVSAPTAPPLDVHTKTYVNSVYRYHIDYPDELLIPQGESDSGDGQVFLSKDKLCELRVYRDTRDILYEGAILKKSYREDIGTFNKDSISNSELTEDYYIIEGKNNNEYFHQKTFLRKDNLLVTAIYSYKPEVSETYKSVTYQIFKSMR